RQQGVELRAVLVQAAPAVLVVDPDQQRNQVEARCGPGRVDRGGQLVGGPAGGGDDPRVGQGDAVGAQRLRQLQRPAAVLGDALADGVVVAEGEVAQRGSG